MKTLPGLKIVGFVILTLTVAIGVYAATKHKPDPEPRWPNVVIKFGLGEPLDVKYDRVKRIIEKFQKDPALYRVEEYDKDGNLINHAGALTTCSETTLPTPPPTPSPTPAGSPRPTAAPSAIPTPSAAPTITPASGGRDPGTKSTKTQTSGAVALSIGHSREFFRLLNAADPEHKKNKKSKKD
jgi:hypothetical protein